MFGLRKMTRAVRDAVFEWFAGLLIGFLPLFGHLSMGFILDDKAADAGNWSVDILFVAITTSGTSIVSVVMRVMKGSLPKECLSTGIGVLLTMSVIMLMLSGAVYGAVASGHANSYSLFLAFVFLVGSAISSLYVELGLANARQRGVVETTGATRVTGT